MEPKTAAENTKDYLNKESIKNLILMAKEKQSLLAICFYNKGCQLEFLNNKEEALESYQVALRLEKAKFDPFKMGDALMAKFEVRDLDHDAPQDPESSLLKQFQMSIDSLSVTVKKRNPSRELND